MSRTQQYKRLVTLNIPACLLLIAHEEPLVINDVKIKVSGPRLRTYLKGTDCVQCGLKGAFFAAEATRPQFTNFHLNLYALNQHGHEVMMTSDHIHPKSKGGLGGLSNRQPMCIHCNEKKGNKVPADAKESHCRVAERENKGGLS